MTFIIKPGDPIYYPAISNEIFISESTKGSENILQIKDHLIYFLNNGKLKDIHQHASIFPATEEYWQKLKLIFPSLKDPAKTTFKIKENLVKSIIDRVGSCLLGRNDNFNNLIITVTRKNSHIGHYDVPINPYTLKEVKSVEEYLQIPSVSLQTYKYCIEVTEYEPDWGAKPDDPLWFDSEAEAEAFLMARKNDKYVSYKYVGLKLYKDK